MPNVDLVRETAFSPRWPADIKKRHSTTLSRTPFRHLTQFQLNNPAGGPMARGRARANNGSSEGSRNVYTETFRRRALLSGCRLHQFCKRATSRRDQSG